MEITSVPDIAGLSTILKTNEINSEIGTALLADQLDTISQVSDAMTKMMELSVNPSVGGNLDLSV